MLTIIVFILFICNLIALIYDITKLVFRDIISGDNMSNEKKEDIRKYYK